MTNRGADNRHGTQKNVCVRRNQSTDNRRPLWTHRLDPTAAARADGAIHNTRWPRRCKRRPTRRSFLQHDLAFRDTIAERRRCRHPINRSIATLPRAALASEPAADSRNDQAARNPSATSTATPASAAQPGWRPCVPISTTMDAMRNATPVAVSTVARAEATVVAEPS